MLKTLLKDYIKLPVLGLLSAVSFWSCVDLFNMLMGLNPEILILATGQYTHVIQGLLILEPMSYALVIYTTLILGFIISVWGK